MPSTVRRRSGKPLTVTDVIAAGRNMLRAGTPTNPGAIRERMDAIDAVMGCLTGPNYATDFYVKLGQEWSRLSAILSGGSSRSITSPGSVRRSADEYARAELAWQASGGFAATRAIPASWQLPERPRAKVDPPSIRLDADQEPRVKVILTPSAYQAIAAEAFRCGGDVETGGWLAGHRPRNWHTQQVVTTATVAARARKATSVALDTREFARMDARLQAARDRDGDLRGLGDWHTHPGTIGQPSEADLRCQALDLATIGDHNVSLTSLIVTRNPRSDSWSRPQISAWITRPARSSFGERMVCEPAIVSIP